MHQAIQHPEPERHWTAASADDFVYRITFDFIAQLEKKMESIPMTQAELANKLGVTEASVSRVINNPDNLTLKTVVKYARAAGIKVGLVAYDDGDQGNESGPVDSEIFNICWKRAGKPHEFWALEKPQQTSNTVALKISGGTYYWKLPSHSSLFERFSGILNTTSTASSSGTSGTLEAPVFDTRGTSAHA